MSFFRRWVAPISVGLAVLALLVGTGLWGLDFGYHWDEGKLVHALDRLHAEGAPLPTFYNYPSFSYWVAAAVYAVAPPVSRIGVADPAFHLRVRVAFLLFSSAVLIWLFAAVVAAGGLPWEAATAVGMLGLSWELGYHLRWIAPDGPLMVFGAATLFCVLMAKRRPRQRRWIRSAAVAAGLATGSKYPGGLLILPVLLVLLQEVAAARDRAAALPWRRLTDRVFLGRAAGALGLLLAAYLVTTPGTLIEPGRFFHDVFFEVRHYLAGHYEFTAPRGPAHLARMLVYLGAEFFSAYLPVALGLAVLVLAGAAALIRREPRTAAVILVFPVGYLLYFSLQKVFIVRNLLVVTPFLALLAARGAREVLGAVRLRALRALAVSAMVAILLVNAGFLVRAAASIRSRSPERDARKALQYARAKPGRRIAVSKGTRGWLEAVDDSLPPNLVSDLRNADQAFILASEAFRLLPFPQGDRPESTLGWFGPREVNVEYYISWSGDDRILLYTAKKAMRLGLSKAYGDSLSASDAGTPP
jgi:hypothetical protein